MKTWAVKGNGRRAVMRIVKSVQNEKRSGQNWKNCREISRLIGRIVECEEGVVKEHFNKMIYSMNCVKL